MNRRHSLDLLGGVACAWPSAARGRTVGQGGPDWDGGPDPRSEPAHPPSTPRWSSGCFVLVSTSKRSRRSSWSAAH